MNQTTKGLIMVFVGLCGLLAMGLITTAPVPRIAATPPEVPLVAAPSTPAASGRELNLFWHYERDLRYLLRGSTYPACVTRLAEDVGCSRIEEAQRLIILQKDYAAGVAYLTAPLALSPAERQAWTTMLPILQADEERPTWQKAGVRR